MKKVSLFMVMTMLLSMGSVCFAQINEGASKSRMMLDMPRVPNFVKFFTAEDNRVLRATESGVFVYEIPSLKMLASDLTEEQFISLDIHPDNPAIAFTSTDSGKVFKLTFLADELKSMLVPQLSNSPVGLIKDFIFKEDNSEIIVAADERNLYWSMDGGTSWDLEGAVELGETINHRIATLTHIPNSTDTFLVSTSAFGRYSVNWISREIEFHPDNSLPHGYKIHTDGFSYISIGDGSDYLNVKDLEIYPLEIILFDGETAVYYVAGLGKSPLLV